MGLDDPWSIRADDMRERVNGARSDAIDTIYSFLEPGVLVDGAGADLPVSYRRAWNLARADSFRHAG